MRKSLRIKFVIISLSIRIYIREQEDVIKINVRAKNRRFFCGKLSTKWPTVTFTKLSVKLLSFPLYFHCIYFPFYIIPEKLHRNIPLVSFNSIRCTKCHFSIAYIFYHSAMLKRNITFCLFHFALSFNFIS